MPETEHHKRLHVGVGDTLARVFELAAIPVLFGLGGRWLDERLGLAPVATVTLVVLALVGQAARIHYGR